MKIALCTSDFFEPVQSAIREHGAEVVKVFTSCPLDTGFSDRTRQFAEDMRAEFAVGRVTEADVMALADAGVELLLAAAYDFKVPTPEVGDLRFINVHGSLLPQGKGPWPQPWILMKYPEFAGVTLHSMTQQWDHGDIILQRKIPIEPEDNLDSLIAKTLVVTRELTRDLLDDFYQLWAKRRPMESLGSYWPKPTIDQRTIDLKGTVESARLIYRAFGQFSRFAHPIENSRRACAAFYAWKEMHSFEPGTLVTQSAPRLIFALVDGYASIIPGAQSSE